MNVDVQFFVLFYTSKEVLYKTKTVYLFLNYRYNKVRLMKIKYSKEVMIGYRGITSMKILRDGHIHSPFCPHGTKDAFELYVDKAIREGLKEITFTEHMPLPKGFINDEALIKECAPVMEVMEDYFDEVEAVKEKYKGRIKINTGMEIDYLDDLDEETKKILDKLGHKLQDGIISVHFVKIADEYRCIDMSAEEFGKLAEILGSVEKLYDKYFETVLKEIKADLGQYKPKRIGHPMLIRKFNKAYPIEYKNIKLLEEIVSELKKGNYEVDYNTAGLRKEQCKEVYVSGIFEELLDKYGIKKVYGSDAHCANDVGSGFENR